MVYGRYFVLGTGLVSFGAVMGAAAYLFLKLVPFTALGISCIILGLAAMSLPEQVTGSDAMKALVRGSAQGIEPLLQEIRARRRKYAATGRIAYEIPSLSSSSSSAASDDEAAEETALTAKKFSRLAESDGGHEEEDEDEAQKDRLRPVYLPPALPDRNGRTQAVKKPSPQTFAAKSLAPPEGEGGDDGFGSVYIPLGDYYPAAVTVEEMRRAPTMLLVNGEDQGDVRVFTPAAALGEIFPSDGMDLDDALEYVLVESAELCGSIRATELEGSLVLQINNVKLSEAESEAYRELLGSLPTSIAASVVAAVLRKPVVIVDERITPARTMALLSVQG